MVATVAIVGRPNVGKSTLFNRLVERRQALVDSTPGVTRDRIYGEAEWGGTSFRVIDTGGLDLQASSLSAAIRSQTEQAIAEADLLVCLLDGREGLTAVDETIVAQLRRADRPIIYAVNKVDTARQEDLLAEFARLGSASIVPISAEHGRRIDELLDAILAALARRPGGVGGEGYPERAASMGMTPPRVRLSAAEARKPPPRFMADPPTIVGGEPTRPESLDPHQGVAPLRIAIIGRPNVGKSTLVNRLAGAPRVVAHELPGTTRDAIDVAIIAGRNRYLLVDTAGIRRKSKSLGRVEKFSIIKALQAMERADVAIIVMDASEGCTHQDRQLVAEVARAYRPALIALNKWDLVPRARWTAQVAATREVLGELNRLPIQPIAASTGRDCARLLPLVRRLAAASSRRFQTAALNRLLVEAQRRHHLPSYRTQPVRCYYATQVGVAPPTFTIFANYPDAIPESYQRYLRKAIEVAIGAPGLPIRLRFLRRR